MQEESIRPPFDEVAALTEQATRAAVELRKRLGAIVTQRDDKIRDEASAVIDRQQAERAITALGAMAFIGRLAQIPDTFQNSKGAIPGEVKKVILTG